MPPNALERVGKVAASTASDLYLCQHLLVFLKYSDVCRWTVAFGLYGGKVAGSAATDDGDVEWWIGHIYILICLRLFLMKLQIYKIKANTLSYLIFFLTEAKLQTFSQVNAIYSKQY